MKSSKAWAPANISLLFKVVPHDNPTQMGSLGCGLTVNEGVTVNVSQSDKHVVFFNGKQIQFPTVTRVANTLTMTVLTIDIRSNLPLGSGFGISGASALATAYAINELLALKKSNLELAKLAHTAEVENKTGLGDVINQYYGGFFVKFVPSSQFIAQPIPINNVPVYCRSYGKLLTSSILNNASVINNVNNAADTAITRVGQLLKSTYISLPEILAIAKQFAMESSLLTSPRVIQTIQDIERRGGHASMIMLGEGIVSDIPFEGATKFMISTLKASVLASKTAR